MLQCRYMNYFSKHPWVTLITLGDDGQPDTENAGGLRIYAGWEYDNFEKAILSFADYIQLDGVSDGVSHKSSIWYKADSAPPGRSDNAAGFVIDCSRSRKWILVRYSERNGKPTKITGVTPKTVMEKEKCYPIHLAFHEDDRDFLRHLMKDLRAYFNRLKHLINEKETLETRFTWHYPPGEEMTLTNFNKRTRLVNRFNEEFVAAVPQPTTPNRARGVEWLIDEDLECDGSPAETSET